MVVQDHTWPSWDLWEMDRTAIRYILKYALQLHSIYRLVLPYFFNLCLCMREGVWTSGNLHVDCKSLHVYLSSKYKIKENVDGILMVEKY